MSLLRIELESAATDVMISAKNRRIVVVSNKDVAVYGLDLSKRPVPNPTLIWRSDALDGQIPRQVAFLDDQHVYVLTDSWDKEENGLWASNDQDELLFQGLILEPGRASSIVQRVDYLSLYVQFQDGTIYDISPDGSLSNVAKRTALLEEYPSFSPEAKIAIVGGRVCILSDITFNANSCSLSLSV